MKFLGERQAILIVFAVIFIYVLIMGAVSVARHYNFQTQAWDMGIFAQTFWNTAHGRVMQNSIEEVPNHFGVHMSPILFILVPGFLIFPSVYYLLIVQTLALALGAWPLYLFAKKILERKDLALALAAGYLLYPPLHWVNLFDFHPVAFLVPALLAAFYFFYEKKWFWFWVFMVVAAASQEDAVLAAMFAGLFLAALRWDEKKERKMGLAAALIALVYFVLSMKIIMPYFGGGLLRLDRYAELGGSVGEIARNLLFNPALFFKTAFSAQKLSYLFWLFLPVAFLPFVYLPAILLLIPGLLENLLTSFGNQFSGFYQYDSMLIAGIFISSVYGLRTLLKRRPDKALLFKSIIICAIFAGFLLRSPVSPFSFPVEFFKSNERQQTLRQIVKSVPSGASVAAETNIVPHLSDREYVYMSGSEPFMVDVVILDGADFFGFKDPDSFRKYADSYANAGEYDVRVIKERYIVFTKKGLFLETEQ
ncbi:MAG: DUF2079 domain-containing protein [Patescibacteria group bacterium]